MSAGFKKSAKEEAEATAQTSKNDDQDDEDEDNDTFSANLMPKPKVNITLENNTIYGLSLKVSWIRQGIWPGFG